MKERPILFSGPMVRAILDGRKTQTRQVVKNQERAWNFWRMFPTPSGDRFAFRCNITTHDLKCTYGQQGDRLWVRETWMDSRGEDRRWKSPVTMPRWASRITLEVESVRVERLQEISEEDAKAEGIDGWHWDGDVLPFVAANRHLHPAVLKYALLWQSINGPGSWAENPWVWVVTFRRV